MENLDSYSDGYPEGDGCTYIEALINNFENLQESALEMGGDERVLRIGCDIVSRVILIRQLLHAYDQSPDRSIVGPGGVAQQLGITRNGVFARIDLAGLSPQDFWERGVTLESLVKKSTVVGPIAQRVMDCSGQYLLLLNALEESEDA